MPGVKLLSAAEANRLVVVLGKTYNDAKYYLNFKTPVDLVVAAILSAQTRDEITNSVTPKLFAKYRTAKDYADADPEEFYTYISRVSFGGNKAKSIIGAMKIISERYNGKVPDKMEELVELPGIGRKTANTILINAYGIVAGIPVDTWVIKLAPRLGLSGNSDPDKIEHDLMNTIDKKHWHNITYILKRHGKALCGKIPICSRCPVQGTCPKNGVTKMN